MFDPIWLVLLLPLLGALLCGTLAGSLGRGGVGFIACGAVGGAFLVSASRLWQIFSGGPAGEPILWNWLELPLRLVDDRLAVVNIDVAALIDPLSITMLSVVTGVGFLIHWYSTEYMADEPDYGRFFTYLNLFIAAMVLLVMANNFALLLIGWGCVGFASYSLIGFWYQKPSAVAAARKAFVINVVGDLGLMLAVFILAWQVGSLNYSVVLTSDQLTQPIFQLVALLLLVAAYAKSAQLALHTWLPDAMEGPTPVSALIHAATMVTAGVYLVVRCHAIYEAWPIVAAFITLWGGLTAFVAATAAMTQTDLKRVLAYSTMSQLGYMFMAAGVGAYAAAIFHLVTHAFFKALLFLGAGMVIHAVHGEQDMRKMGGLGRPMMGVAVLFGIGAAGLAGVPGLAGFFSKEAILISVQEAHGNEFSEAAWLLAMATAVLTAYYTSRAFCMTFLGGQREHHDLHRPGAAMVISCTVLAFLTIVAGYGHATFEGFMHMGVGHHGEGYTMAIVTSLLVIAAIVVGWMLHGRPGSTDWGSQDGAVQNYFRGGWAFDDLYEITAGAISRVAGNVATHMDVVFTERIPDLLGQLGIRSGEGLGMTQTGSVRHYAAVLLAAVAVFVFYILFAPGGV